MLRAFCGVLLLLAAGAVSADAPRAVATPHRFEVLLERLDASVTRNGLAVVAAVSASRGAAGRGLKIPGNAVIMVFRNDFAVRMLAASIPAGIEAPLRLYVTENPDGTSVITWRTAQQVFASYANRELLQLAAELDPLLEAIVRDAARP